MSIIIVPPAPPRPDMDGTWNNYGNNNNNNNNNNQNQPIIYDMDALRLIDINGDGVGDVPA